MNVLPVFFLLCVTTKTIQECTEQWCRCDRNPNPSARYSCGYSRVKWINYRKSGNGDIGYLVDALFKTIISSNGMPDVVLLYDRPHENNIWTKMKTSTPMQVFDISNSSSANIQSILDMTYGDTHRKTTVFLVVCDGHCFAQVLHEANHHELKSNEQGYLTFKALWVLVADFDEGLTDYLTPKLDNINNVLLITWNATDSYELFTALWEAGGRKFNKIEHENRTLSFDELFPNVKFRLSGRHFSVSTNLWFSFVEEDPSGGPYKGISMELLKALAFKLNFTYTISLPLDGKWGGLGADGSWNGLVGQLQRKEVDMVVAPLSRNWQRENVMDSTLAYSRVYYSAVYRRERPQKLSLYSRPLHWQVYACLLTSLVVMATLLVAVEKRLPSSNLTDRSTLSSFVVLSTCGACALQSVQYNPTTYSSRLLFGCWWVMCVVVMSTYTGNLMAVLTVDKPKVPFRTLNDLANSQNYKVGAQGATISTVILQQSKTGVYARIWDRIENLQKSDAEVLDPDNKVHVRKVKSENYAYITDQAENTAMRSEDCNLQSIEERFHPTDYAVALQNNSVYTDMVSQVILELRDTGLLKKWHDIYGAKVNCARDDVKKGRTLTLGDIQGAFLGLAGCLGVSLVLLFLEIIYHFHGERHLLNIS